jgi:peptidoglycan/xylan/chitin deacetylase (PgdA/CDA1 family)
VFDDAGKHLCNSVVQIPNDWKLYVTILIDGMAIHPRIVQLILKADQILAACSLPVIREDGALLIFLFHSLFSGREDLQSQVIDPEQGITVEMLRRFIGHFQDQGYRFVSSRDVLAGLPPRGRYALLTFDDGYYSNSRALPVLEAADAPALLYVSTGNVKHGKAFWWDVLYRENQRRGGTRKQLRDQLLRCKRRKTSDIEMDLLRDAGPAALHPCSDLDRPFTAAELKDFAAHPLISLGNHTRDHAILTNYSAAEVREQLQGAQDDIREMTGFTPESVAYPNGNQSAEIVRAAIDIGLRMGVGVQSSRNHLPLQLDSPKAMNLKRFTLLGDRPIEAQCRASRAGLSLYQALRNAKPRANAELTPISPA